MPVTLSDPAIDKSTYVVVTVFRDENDQLVVPNSGLNWTLTDDDGTVINSRSAVAITAASTIKIVLSGADLDFDDGEVRVLTVEGTYNSILGTNLPIKDQVTFKVKNLVAVS